MQEFSSRTCETFRLPELGVALHGHSFPHRAVPEDLSAGYRDPAAGMLNIGVLHTSAEDPGEHETYAPCQVGALRLKGYDYWALGHIHARRVLRERPWVVFPGNLQGRHPKETGAKGCSSSRWRTARSSPWNTARSTCCAGRRSRSMPRAPMPRR